MSKPKALVLCGDGINCDAETAFALTLAGFEAEVMHSASLLEQPALLKNYQVLIVPGGFSFGDEIASGKVLALKLKDRLSQSLNQFVDDGKLLIGICNGFQVLVQLGILPAAKAPAEKLASLTRNSTGKFTNRWTKLVVDKDVNSPLLKSLEVFELPIRHGEGRLSLGTNEKNGALVKKGAALRYETDINGSFDRIAALTNSSGNVFGLMPHPEAFVRWTQHPNWTRLRSLPDTPPPGLVFFMNAYAMAAN